MRKRNIAAKIQITMQSLGNKKEKNEEKKQSL